MEDQLRAAVLDAVRDYSTRFTMDDIARKLHISKATLYQKAPSKEALIAMVLHDRMERFDRAEADIVGNDDTAEGKVLAYAELFVSCFWEMPDRVYQDLQAHYPAVWQDWDNFMERKFDDMMGFLETAVEKKEFRDVNLTVLRMVLISACQALNDPEFLKEGNLTGADVMNALEDIILRGIQIRKA